MLLASCSGNTGPQPALDGVPLAADAAQQPVATKPAAPGYPAFPVEWPGVVQPPRAVAETLSQPGNTFAEQSAPSGSYQPGAQPDSYVLVPPDGGSFAWARYYFPGVTGDRPVSLSVTTADAAPADGGDVVPQALWIGVANYTTYSWDWHGPLGGGATIPLNRAAGELPALLSRHVSAAGGVHVVVLADASQISATPGNPDALTAVRVNTVAIETDAGYEQNLPHYAPITYAGIGSGSKGAVEIDGKEMSTLRPEQFVYLEWLYVEPFDAADEENAADAYVVLRHAPLVDSPEEVFRGIASQFVDPLDVADGAAAAQGGTQYTYSLYAENEAGMTPRDSAVLIVPMLAPTSVAATLDSAGQDAVELTWQAADGAREYEVYRGESVVGSAAQLIATVPEGQTAYTDADADPGLEWWYFVRAVGLGDGTELNGREAGQVSGYSLGAKGLRRLQLTIGCETGGVAGTGTAGDPYVLTAGNTYQFSATGQDGVAYTVAAEWSVEPESAAEFSAATPGLLESVQPAAGNFTVTATYDYLTYSWSSSADCSAGS